MRRREFISTVDGASLLPLAARAQKRPNPVIGYLHIGRARRVSSMLRRLYSAARERRRR